MSSGVVQEADEVLVLCVGMPLRHVGELAKLLRDLAVVVAAPDVEGALTLLRDVHAGQDDPAQPPRAVVPSALDAHAVGPAAPLIIGTLRIASASREVSVAGIRVHLSAQEFDLLAALASDTHRVWSFEDLTAQVWQTDYLGDREHVNSAIKRLRRRLAGRPGIRIVSVRGVGYRLMVGGASSVPTPLSDALRRSQRRPRTDDAAEDAA
ncbi:winged helix-turn-helix domain-containing protein [Microbacterium sp. B35-30]|uniref:winged helix-turn-helix domain-containing protein n=1 Tax=Microbacterium sp. B35-30 TaxID=1962642 RepID=UPI0013D5BE52|nr:winged helix-turn-helix domain-containing protein [Microbacterium sp. B35-30]